MKIHVLSDLHVEFSEFQPPTTECDVVVLAGDIGVGIDALYWAQERYKHKPVIYVLGNHEFYGQDLNMVTKFKREARNNFHILDDDFVVIDGVRFLGSVLWTDFALFGEGEQYFSMQHAVRGMPDFEVIRCGDRRITPRNMIDLHRRSRDWLADILAAPFDGSTVVVTHHAPSLMSVAPRFKTDQMSPRIREPARASHRKA